MGIKLVEENTKYFSGKHSFGEDIQISCGSIVVFSCKPPSTDSDDAINYDGDTCIAICNSDQDGGSVAYAADHIARLNSYSLEHGEVGYTHTCMGLDIGYNQKNNIQKMVQMLLPAKEEKWRKFEEEILLNQKKCAELEEVKRQTRFLNKMLEKYKREDYTDLGWNRVITNLREFDFPKANIEEIK